MAKPLSLDGAAKRIGVTRQTLRHWLLRGVGPCYTKSPLGRYAFREEDILDWQAKLKASEEERLKALEDKRRKCAPTRDGMNIGFVGIGKAAKMVGVCRDTLTAWAERGVGPHYKVSPGRHRLYRESDIIRWANGLPGPAVIEVPEQKKSEELRDNETSE